MSPHPEITAIIPHRRSIELLWATVQSVRQAGISEIIIYGNGRERLPFHDLLGCTVLWNDEGIGPAAARECGSNAVTDADWLFFVDDDSIVPSGIFDDIPPAHAIFYPAGTYGPAVSYDYDLLPVALENHIDYPIRQSPRSPKPYRCISGSNGQFLICRSVWKAIDGYGRAVDGYGPEELMLGLRLAMYGFDSMLDPRYIVQHFPSREPWKNRDEAFMARCRKVVDVLKQDKLAKHTLEEVYERLAHHQP